MEKSGRGIHKRRKKSARSHFEHRKCNSSRRQLSKETTTSMIPEALIVDTACTVSTTISQNLQDECIQHTCSPHSSSNSSDITSTPVLVSPCSVTTQDRVHPCAVLDILHQELKSLIIPSIWKMFSGEDFLQFSKFEVSAGQFKAIVSVKISPDLKYRVFVGDTLVPESCRIIQEFRTATVSKSSLSELIKCIDNAVPCPGNSDSDFVDLCKENDGIIRGEKGNGNVIAYVDSQAHCSTIKRIDCELLVDKDGRRCKRCQSLRATLRSRRSRQHSISEEAKVSVSSHCKYSALTSSQKTKRLKNLHNSVRLTKQQLARLQNKATSMLQAHSIRLHPNDSDDIHTLVSNLTSTVHEQFPTESAQRIFWDQQMKYNALKDKRQMRWHPLIIRFALNLKYSSTTAYHAMQQSGIIHLPSDRTLFDYTHWMTAQSGVQLHFIEEFCDRANKEIASNQFHCALSLDEMKIKSGIVFDKHKGKLLGFVDLGTVNRDIDKMMGVQDHEEEVIADHVLVIMARAVFKPSLAVPIAHFFSRNLTGEKIFPIMWEAVETLELYNIPVVSITSDGAKPNRRFYHLCNTSSTKNVPYKTKHPFRKNADLYFFCDAPHLLKTARNCFSNSFAHSQSRKMEKCGQEISWKWIESLYLTETSTPSPGVRLCHKLTREHVWLNSFSRMRVNLATEVMSESVASALEYLANEKTKQTRLFIRMIDRFFDYLNVKSPNRGIFKRKESVAPYKTSKDERFKWLEEVFLGYFEEWERELKGMKELKRKEKQRMCLSRETLEGLRITVKSFTELGRILLDLPEVEYLLSEVFSQDPLERYFSRQRHRGGSCDNPTAYQVPHNAVTLLQQQCVYNDLKTMNVEVRRENDYSLAFQPLRKRPRTKS